MRRIYTLVFLFVCFLFSGSSAYCTVPPVVHSKKGDTSPGVKGRLRITNIGKKQQYAGGDSESRDKDIFSPKSVTFSTDGSKFYVNSLEGCKTAVYDATTMQKLGVMNYSFTSKDHDKTAEPSGYYPFTHYKDGATRAYSGKPVESTWSHNGRYLWVPFYRRTFDINAQDPSAIAVIDSKTDSIIRIFETGPLPKMVATSHDGMLLAITHWGDNTVGFMDISSDKPTEWHHLPPVTVGNKLKLNYSLTQPVNRDSNSGFLLRGTVFTPDDRYLLVSGMAGPLQVIDTKSMRHVGSVGALYGIRHLDISGDYLFGSQNTGGTVVRTRLDSLISAIDNAVAKNTRTIATKAPITTVKVGGGARTLCVSPDGEYVFVACNAASEVVVVDAETMKVVDRIRCDSYPVGLELSADGHRMITTSQARSGYGGNAVNIYEIERFDSDSTFIKQLLTDKLAETTNLSESSEKSEASEKSEGSESPAISEKAGPSHQSWVVLIERNLKPILASVVTIALITFVVVVRRRKRSE